MSFGTQAAMLAGKACLGRRDNLYHFHSLQGHGMERAFVPRMGEW